MMKTIENTFFEGERPLFASEDLLVQNVKFYPGESALKQCLNIKASNCEFMGKYPFWHNNNTQIENCRFTVYARAAIWYSQNLRMINCVVDAPKMFREVTHFYLENTQLLSAAECCWNCHHAEFHNVEIHGGDYLFMNGSDINIDGFRLQGNYAFQDAHNVVIRNAHLDSKDAFWNTENVTVYDSVLNGEYLGWHSKNLRLVNCKISGEQPLCYATDLVMENCTMTDTNLCFEYSTLQADIQSEIISVKNPRGGYIRANHIQETIIDENCINPGACEIVTATHAGV
ncbi:DUF3737 family protein [Mangrovibacter plantisponsor]|uniref:Uncharacterized protein DUF3737 n=1 Tax=Mangrovibacter plantisponsor TaxID=451513 RepID=A0A317QCR5_9ENTR|nr:DUF3737 family protein [Mangrovibacter plantisponsor]PWW12780.1 uncharacterized protein DUF3737 [Mangrovibacter plantisponsor]